MIIKKLITKDGKSIAASYFEPESGNRIGLILMHMLNKDRHSFDSFAEDARAKGFSALSMDFRGHGDSEGKWQEFSEADFRNMEYDSEAAMQFMLKCGISRIYVVGASIGANTAINFSHKNKEIMGAVALSPSFNYRGIITKDSSAHFTKRLFIMVSESDNKSYDDSISMYRKARCQKAISLFKGEKHGTELLDGLSWGNILVWIGK